MDMDLARVATHRGFQDEGKGIAVLLGDKRSELFRKLPRSGLTVGAMR